MAVLGKAGAPPPRPAPSPPAAATHAKKTKDRFSPPILATSHSPPRRSRGGPHPRTPGRSSLIVVEVQWSPAYPIRVGPADSVIGTGGHGVPRRRRHRPKAG